MVAGSIGAYVWVNLYSPGGRGGIAVARADANIAQGALFRADAFQIDLINAILITGFGNNNGNGFQFGVFAQVDLIFTLTFIRYAVGLIIIKNVDIIIGIHIKL